LVWVTVVALQILLHKMVDLRYPHSAFQATVSEIAVIKLWADSTLVYTS